MRGAFGFAQQRRGLSTLVGILGPGVTAEIVQYVLTGGLIGWTPIVTAVVGGALTWVALTLINVPVTKHNLRMGLPVFVQLFEPPAPPYLPADRYPLNRVSPRTPEELVEEVKGLTNIRAREMIRPHIGLFLPVRGTIAQATPDSASSNTIAVRVSQDYSAVDISLRFDANRWGQRLSTSQVGDPVAAVGKISNVQDFLGGLVQLVECDLLDQ